MSFAQNPSESAGQGETTGANRHTRPPDPNGPEESQPVSDGIESTEAAAPPTRAPHPLTEVPAAPAELAAQVYEQLRALAQRQMAAERAGHTLSATALVHEAYVRLNGERRVPWQARAHFYAAAAEAMRRILVDHARAKAAVKRGGKSARAAALDLARLPDPASEEESAGFLILNEAIARLEGAAADAAAVVRLRFFGGLSTAETADALGMSEATVKRTWAFARAWLKDWIERNA